MNWQSEKEGHPVRGHPVSRIATETRWHSNKLYSSYDNRSKEETTEKMFQVHKPDKFVWFSTSIHRFSSNSDSRDINHEGQTGTHMDGVDKCNRSKEWSHGTWQKHNLNCKSCVSVCVWDPFHPQAHLNSRTLFEVASKLQVCLCARIFSDYWRDRSVFMHTPALVSRQILLSQKLDFDSRNK